MTLINEKSHIKRKVDGCKRSIINCLRNIEYYESRVGNIFLILKEKEIEKLNSLYDKLEKLKK